MSCLGIDIGTNGSKAVVFNEEGEILSWAAGEYPLISSHDGWFELDSRQVITLCKNIISEAARKVCETDPVSCIGIASQGEAFTLLDGDNNYLSNAMVSFDVRSKDQVEKACTDFGKEKLYEITGHSAHALFSLFKLLWIRKNQRELFDKAKRLLCFGDLLRYELTGNALISYNLAARTMMLDVQKKAWSKPILDYAGISDEMLPELTQSGVPAGTICPKIAREFGLDKNVIVSTGGHDQCCGGLGVGVEGAGMAAYSVGTVECITPAFEGCILNETMMNSNFATYPYILEGLYTTVAFCTTGGSGLKWFIDQLCECEKKASVNEQGEVYRLMLEQMPDGPSGLFVVPHFASTGTPYFDPSPLGAVLGINLNTKKGELLKGLLEGISFEMKLNLELLQASGIEVKRLRAFGGGSRNDRWMQIKADVFGLPIECLEVGEAGCMGAAMLAAKAAQKIENINECTRNWVKIARTYEPNEGRKEIYADKYGVYKTLYGGLLPIKNEIMKMGNQEI